MCTNGNVKTNCKSCLLCFEAMSLCTHTLFRTSLFRISYSLSVAISTAIALTAVWLILRLVFQLMAQSTFDERLVHFSDRGVHIIACMRQSRRVSNSTHMSIVSILLTHFSPIVKRVTVFVEWSQRLEISVQFRTSHIWNITHEHHLHRHVSPNSRNLHNHA